jgi:sigma-B regulation protein RsbU (phosphoserine phosphatase)
MLSAAAAPRAGTRLRARLEFRLAEAGLSDATVLEGGGYDEAFALLAEMTQHFGHSADLEATLGRALGSIAAHVGAEAGSLWLLDPEARELACEASVGPHPITGLRLPANEGIVGKSVRENACQSVLDVAQDPDFSQRMDEQSGFVTRSILCAPMSFSNQVIGAVELINKGSGDGRFRESDAHLLQVLASSAGLAIANARLAAAQIEHERVRRELELAAEIQRNLLPTPRGAPFPVYGVNVPARTVSGDFFDILPLTPESIAFCLGDVSGKGINAALLMAKTASLYRCLAKDTAHPGLLLRRLNEEICETATRGMFVTMVAGVYDPRRGTTILANAGHEPPLLRRRGGEFEAFEAEAPPLGVLPGVDYPELELDLEGGALYVCTDGLTEAGPPAAPLGASGVRELLQRFAGKPLGERIEAVVGAAAAMEPHDDVTLLGVSHAEGGNR